MLRNTRPVAILLLLVCTVLLAVALYPERAYTIGRIGNHRVVGDRADLYSVKVPKAFGSIAKASDGRAILESGLFASSHDDSSPMPVDIQMLSFRSQFPRLVNKGQRAIEEYFLASPGIRYRKVEVRNGALTLFGESNSSYVGISVCGDGRGFVAFAPKLVPSKAGVTKLIHNTVFEEPCRK